MAPDDSWGLYTRRDGPAVDERYGGLLRGELGDDAIAVG